VGSPATEQSQDVPAVGSEDACRLQLNSPSVEALVPEREWILQAQAGDSRAFGRLVESYAGRVYGLLYRLVRNREEAEDLAQETFVRAFRNLGRFDSTRPFRNWLYTICINAGLNVLRSRRRRGVIVPLDTVDSAGSTREAPVAPGPDARCSAMRGELRERLDTAVSQLPARSALLVQLHYTEGLPIREAAGIVGMTEGAAKVALCRARGTLRRLLVEEEL